MWMKLNLHYVAHSAHAPRIFKMKYEQRMRAPLPSSCFRSAMCDVWRMVYDFRVVTFHEWWVTSDECRVTSNEWRVKCGTQRKKVVTLSLISHPTTPADKQSAALDCTSSRSPESDGNHRNFTTHRRVTGLQCHWQVLEHVLGEGCRM